MQNLHVRIDYHSIPRIKKTDEGYFITNSPVTRVGVFKYMLPDGTIRKELRTPEEVFNADSMETMKLIPVTDNHPRVDGGLLDSTNAKEYTIGFTGENVSHNDTQLITNLKVTDIDGIGEIEAGKHEISCGYTCELEESAGTFDGEDYTHIQRNIKYNHVAIVNRGRAGRGVRLRFDNDENVGVQLIEKESNNMSIKVTLDGLQYDAAPEVAKHIDSLNGTIENLNTEKLEVEGKLDTANAELEKAKQEVKVAEAKADALEKEMPEKISKAVKIRVDLEQLAKDTLDETGGIETKSDEDLKKEIILAKFPETNLDGLSNVELNVWLEAAKKVVVKSDAAQKQIKTVFGGEKKVDKEDDPVAAARARQDSYDNNAWKGEDK